MKALLQNRLGFQKLIDIPNGAPMVAMAQLREDLNYEKMMEEPIANRMNQVTYRQIGETNHHGERIPIMVEEFTEELIKRKIS